MNLLEAQLSGNPYDFNIEKSETRSENSKILRSFLNALQYDIKDNEYYNEVFTVSDCLNAYDDIFKFNK